MTSYSDKTRCEPARPAKVVFLVYPGIVLLDLVGPLQVFSHAMRAGGGHGYECVVASVDGGVTPTNTVLPISATPISEVPEQWAHSFVVVGGDGALTAMHDPAVLGTVRRFSATAHRVCSVCSGALILAAAGLLDGRRAVTHWDDCAQLAQEFPKVRVEMDPIYIKDGPVWTSAGITAGIDMALAIVAEDLGRDAAFQVARSMVTQMVRAGGQSQYSPVLHRQHQDAEGQFEALHNWASRNLARPLSVEELAGVAKMSPRNFSRVYTRVMGVTPAKAVEALRVEAARALLETSDLSVKSIAARCGFNDEERMRRTFLRHLRVSPSDYRQRFQVTATPATT